MRLSGGLDLHDAIGRPDNRAVGSATRAKTRAAHMEGAAVDNAMSNHDPVVFGAAARAVGFLGFGF